MAKLRCKAKVQKDILQHFLCDIKTEVGIRDEKKVLGENTIVFFGIFLFFSLRIYDLLKKKKDKNII